MTDKPKLKPCPYCGGSQQPFVPSSNLEEFGDRFEALVVNMNIAPEPAFVEIVGRLQSVALEHYTAKGALEVDEMLDAGLAAYLDKAKSPCAS